MKTEAKWSLLLVVGGMWTVISVSMWPIIANQRRLERAASITHGDIIKVDRADHNRATYRYAVGDKVYTGTELAWHGHSEERVRVYYSPEEPSLSSLRNHRGSFGSNILGLISLYAFVLVGATIMAMRAGR